MPSSAKVPVAGLVGIVSLVLLFLSGPASIAAFLHNLGSVQLVCGLMSPEAIPCAFESSRESFDLSGKLGGTAQFDLSYGSELADLAILDPLTSSYRPDVENLLQSEPGQLLQRAVLQLVLRRADEARHDGQTAEEKAWRILAVELQPENTEERKQLAVWLVSEYGDIATAIAQYETVLKMQEPTFQDYLRLVALNLKIGRTEQVTYWHGQLRRHLPDTGYTHLHDLQNSYAQLALALAEAYAYFGLLDDAISIGERSLAINNWDWGHRVVSRFYQLQGRYPEAERHLLSAIEHPTSETILIQYRVALADVYAEQGKTQQAIAGYCRVLRDASAVDASGTHNPWRGNAVSRLAELAGVTESEVAAVCPAR